MKKFKIILTILIILFKTGNVLSDNDIFNVNNVDINKDNLKKNNVEYLDPPYTRFEGKKEQQETFFIKDPHGNILELKTLKN